MKFTRKHIAYLLFIISLCNAHLYAQESNKSNFADINYIRKSNALLTARNAAGLTGFNTLNITKASIDLAKDNGGFKDYHQSNNSRSYGVQAQSLTRLNDKVVFAGEFGYSNFLGENMTGSAFIDPNKTPFDIVELDATNSGNKQLETYRLNGAIGAAINSKLSLGGRLNYTAANYAKRKDLRHINKLLDMTINAGFLYKISPVLEAGLSYDYSRRIESVSFNVYGNTDRQYLSLIDFGAFYGRSELFGDYGYTGSTNPLKDIKQGASMIVNWSLNSDITWFNEFSFADRNGFFGEEGTSSIMLTKHAGLDLGYKGQLKIVRGKNEHHVSANAKYEKLDNKETIYRRVTSAGGINEIVYFGDRTVYEGDLLDIGLSYDLFVDVRNNRPSLEVNVSGNYLSSDKSVGLYPFFRNQKIDRLQLSTHAKKYFAIEKDALNIGFGLGYGKGGGDVSSDGVITTPSTDHVAPTSISLFLNQEFEYFTASRFNTNVTFEYIKPLPNNISAYAKLNYGLTYAPNVNYLGKTFNQVALSFGCYF
jgi:hypothetical protein